MCLLSERRLAKVEPPSPPHSTAVAEFLGGVKQKSDSGRGQACSKFQHDGGLQNLPYLFWAFQNQRSLRYRTQGVIMLSRALYCRPGSNYPVTLHDCCPSPPPSAASAAEASLPVPRATRASFLSEVSPLPGSRPRLSRFAASDMGLSSWAYAADFVVAS